MTDYECDECGGALCVYCFFNETCQHCGWLISLDMLEDYYSEVDDIE